MSLLDDASLIVTPNGYKASKLYSVKPTDASGDMDVVRATTATRVDSAGVIESVAINVPRLDYTGGGCPSILVEPQRTNLVLYSEEFDNVAWAKTNSTVTANTTTSPDGNLTADKLIEDATNNQHRIDKTTTSAIGTNTFSVFAKKSERDSIRLRVGTSGAYFDLTNGTASGAVGVTTSMENYGNGWYKCAIVRVSTVATETVRINLAIGTNTDYTGDGTSGLFIWGAQLELGSNATSYIPTTTATVTRNADVISKTGVSSLIGQTEGTLYAEVDITNVGTRTIFALDIGATTNYITGTTNATNAVRLAVSSAGSATQLITTSTLAIGFYKIAFAYKSGEYAIYINGVSAGTSLSTTFPIGTLSQFILANASYGTLNDSYNLVTLFPTRLTNAQLATLTTP